LRPIIQRFANAPHHIARHRAVDRIREFDEARLVLQGPQLPRHVQWIDGDAMTAETRARIERHESERLAGGSTNHLEGIDPELAAHHRDLVHEADIYRA